MGSPESWMHRLLTVAILLVIAAWLINRAMQLIDAVLPTIIGIAIAAGVAFVAWHTWRWRRSRW